MKEAADSIGVSYSTLVQHANKSGVKFIPQWEKCRPNDRDDAMAAMYRAGKTLEEIGHLYGITRERVRQIISRSHGLSADDGGQAVRVKINRERRKAEKESECYHKHGCSTVQLRELRKIGRAMIASGASHSQTPVGAFISQRRNAKSRGIEWSLLLWDWWTIWQESGKWDEHGRAADAYVMCRFRDDGPYEIGNVYIATLKHNSAVQPNNPYRKGHPDFEEARKRMGEDARRRSYDRSWRTYKPVNPDLPRGVTLHKGRFIAQCGMDGRNKYLGSFGTPDEAHAAYLSATGQSPTSRPSKLEKSA